MGNYIYISITILLIRQIDPTEFYCQSETDMKPTDLGKDSSGNYKTKMYIRGFSIAILVLILSIIIHNFINIKSDL